MKIAVLFLRNERPQDAIVACSAANTREEAIDAVRDTWADTIGDDGPEAWSRIVAGEDATIGLTVC